MEHAPGDKLDGGRLCLEALLGKGAFGSVWKATEILGFGVGGELIPLRDVAVKCLPPLTDRNVSSRIVEEARALADLDHPAILRLYRAFAEETGTYLITELATEGDLRSYFDYSIPTESELREIAFSIAQGLDYLHAQGFVHGDLKPENILVTQHGEESVRFLLGDFGLRAIVGHRNFQGTVPYIPPEAYAPHRTPLTEKADIYALGVLLFEMATGQRLAEDFSDSTLEALRSHEADAAIVREAHDHLLASVDATDWGALELPPFLGTLIRLCIAVDPKKRPSAIGLLELWIAFERSRRGTLIPYRRGRRTDASRYAILYARAVEIDEDGDVLTAHLAGEGGSFIQVAVSRRTNKAMFDALAGRRDRASDEPPMVSFFGIIPEDLDMMAFRADRNSYVVLEPFELLDVTDVSRSHHCVRAYLHRLVGEGEILSRPLLKGNILHTLFAELVREERLDFDAAWDTHWNRWCLDFAYLFRTDAELTAFRREVEDAFQKMRRTFLAEPDWFSPHRHVETSRWSFELGLSGRIDAFFLSESGRASAYELKTGRVRTDDLLQVQAYVAMLLEDLEGETESADRKRAPIVRAQILTSIDGRLRRVQSSPPYEVLSATRNAMLRLRDLLREPREADMPPPSDYPYFGYDRLKCARCASVQSYVHKACRATTARFGERLDLIENEPMPNPIELDYFWHWVRMTIREEDALRRRYLDPLLETTLSDVPADTITLQTQAERRIRNAVLVERDETTFSFEFPPTVAELNVGDDVLLHRGDLRRWRDVLRGTIEEISDTTVRIHLRSPYAPDEHADVDRGEWVIEFYPDVRGMHALRRALRLFLRSSNAAMKSLLLDGQMPRRQGTLFPAGTVERLDLSAGRRLNAQQRGALLRSLDETGFLSITGPPGTGKTLTIRAIVEVYVREGGRVLIAALTNNAIDNVLERLIGSRPEETIRFLRFGQPSAMHATLAARLEEHGFDSRTFFAHELGAAIQSVEELRTFIESTPVLVGTAHSLVRSPWIADLDGATPPFDLVVVDEATQMPEPFAAALLCLGKKGILVGDEHQLGPVALSTFDPERDGLPASLEERGIRGLDQSLFERLNRLLRERGGEEGQVFLTHQYRMHPTIGAWASEQFYAGRLETAADPKGLAELKRARTQSGWEQLRTILDPDRPLVFLDVEAKPGDLPNACLEEARVAALLARALNEIGIEDVGCITPYRNQLALLRQELDRLGVACECGTVDAFQGREKRVIIVSTVRRDRLTEFLTNARRLNVSVTRAQAKCILLGSRKLLIEHPLLWSLVQHDACFRDRTDATFLARELGLDGVE